MILDFNFILRTFIIPVLIQIWLIRLFTKSSKNPAPLPRSENPKKEKIEIALYTLVVVFYFTVDIFILDRYKVSFYIVLCFSTIILLLIPLIYVRYRDHWTRRDFGITLKVKSSWVVIVGISIYTVVGCYNTLTAEIPWYLLLSFFYSNAFLEEFLFRGIIQSKLERAIGQKKAIIYQGILFMFIHLPVNCFNFFLDENSLRFISAFIFQLINGIIFGLIFLKTRNIWISVNCHYLNNWLGAIITLFL